MGGVQMKKGDVIQLKMIKNLYAEGSADETMYKGSILKYDERQQCLFLLIGPERLGKLSLEGIYECEIQSHDADLKCTGVIVERYCGKYGKTVKFKIKNGFYKINVKYVDK